MKISSGISEIYTYSNNSLQKNYLWPKYGNPPVDKISPVNKKTSNTQFIKKPSEKTQNEIITKSSNFESTYKSNGYREDKSIYASQRGVLFDARA